MQEISIIIILIYRELELVGPVKQKIMLPLPNDILDIHRYLMKET